MKEKWTRDLEEVEGTGANEKLSEIKKSCRLRVFLSVLPPF